MALSTAAKVASGLTVTSVAAGGTALAYKYIGSSLFKSEKEAIESDSWTIKTKSSSNTNAKRFEVSVEDKSKQWVCTLIATATDSSTAPNINNLDILKDLQVYFSEIEIVDQEKTKEIKPDKKHRTGFVNSCAKNRKTKPKPSDIAVESVLRLTLEKTTTGDKYKFKSGELSKVFEGDWVNELYAIEKLASDSNSVLTIKDNTTSNPTGVTFSLKADSITSLKSNYGIENSGSSWTCDVTTETGSTDTLKEKLKKELGINSIATTESDVTLDKSKKEALVNSCSRNRKLDQIQNKDTVKSELKVSKDSIDGDLKEIFEGFFDNKA